MVDSVMQPGKMTNCEEDVDEFLLTLNNSTPAEVCDIKYAKRKIWK